MPVRMFIQERSGNNNHDVTYDSVADARCKIKLIKENGGYEIPYDSLTDDFKFIPWHRIDFIEVTDYGN